jgi:hypothetical protein
MRFLDGFICGFISLRFMQQAEEEDEDDDEEEEEEEEQEEDGDVEYMVELFRLKHFPAPEAYECGVCMEDHGVNTESWKCTCGKTFCDRTVAMIFRAQVRVYKCMSSQEARKYL